MREIPLTHGKVALVDDADFECVSAFSWRLDSNGYPSTHIKDGSGSDGRSTIRMHRFLLNLGSDTDHANQNKLDNRRENLRACTRSQSNMNRKKWRGTSSRFKGVCLCTSPGRWSTGKWEAYIDSGKKRKSLGYYVAEEDAARAYDVAAKEIHGQFALLNFAEGA